MKIHLSSIGSRGDIQPYIALGRTLKSAGHEVCLVTHPWAKRLSDSYGLHHIPIGKDIDIHHEARAFVENSGNNLKSFTFALNFIFDNLRNCHADLMDTLKTADLVVGHGIVGQAESEILGKPFVTVSIAPLGLEKVHWKSENFIKEAGIVVSDAIGRSLFGQPFIKYRKEMNLPPTPVNSKHPYLALVPMSPLLQRPHPN